MTELALPQPPPPTLLQQAATVAGLLALLGSALFGGNVAGMRERFLGSETPETRSAAVSRGDEASPPDGTPAETQPPKQSVLRSQPWWQSVARIQGDGPMTAPSFAVSADALQWRVKWTCQTGQLVVRAPEQRRPVVDAACPGSDMGYGVQKGNIGLQVTASGPWEMQVDQQVDVPLFEPPLPTMTAPGARPVLTGSLYRVDQVGSGTVTIYRLADSSYALRLDNFFVTANSDLELQFNALEAPRTTRQVTDNPSSPSVASLDVTTGSLNFRLPAGVEPTQYGSFVIWCQVANSAYAAATLRPA